MAPDNVWWITHENEEALAGNLIDTPVLFAYGDNDDAYPLTVAKGFFAAISRTGVRAQLQVLKNLDQVNPYSLDPIGFVLPFLARQRLERSPHTVQITASRLKYAETPWIRITGSHEPLQSMKLNARLDATRLIVETTNVSQLEIWPDRLGIARNTSLQIDWNGAQSTTLFQNTPVHLGSTPTSPFGAKSSNIGGPIADVFAGPFEVITGTGGTPAERGSALAATDSFSKSWRAKFFAGCRHKLDTELTPDDIAKFNLILIGKASGNSALARSIEEHRSQFSLRE